jgi:NADPH-dependent 2,4-dienoyl-CoA reductase/sulfur reductase-like enzyme
LHIAIIGNGITGITAARRLRALQPDWDISVISGESTHHYSRPALMYIFMGHMSFADTKPYEDQVWARERIELVRAWVTEIDVEKKQLGLHGKPPLAWDKLLLATGSKSNKFGWPGQDLEGVQGLYDLMDLKQLYSNVERARSGVIVGGGLIGIELAEMLHSRGIHVDLVVRENSYWNNVLPPEESSLVNDAIRAEGMGLHLETNLERIVDDGNGRACAVETDTVGRIDCQVVGLTAGVSPNIDLAQDSPLETGRGILVDDRLETSTPDVFAAGDCAEIVTEGDGRNLLEQVWYTGKAQGAAVAEVMAGEQRRYAPGIWFNSAKFLHLEYQTYGDVGRGLEGERNLVWVDAERTSTVRIVHQGERVVGFNLMGIRYRHETCHEWLRDGRSVEYVLDHLSEANFDPEFYSRHEAEITRTFREQLS